MPAQQVVIGLWILGALLMVWQQLRPRRLRTPLRSPLLWLLLALGVVTLAGAVRAAPRVAPAALGVVVVMLMVAAGAGWLRARTVRLWASGDAVMRRGGALTVVAWAAWVVVHVGLDLAANRLGPGGLGTGALWLGMWASMLAQLAALNRRAGLSGLPGAARRAAR